jgi:fucokinase
VEEPKVRLPGEWDYLIVTASNEKQADWYRSQLALRQELGYILGFNMVLVVADPEGKRIGSCGSTLLCLFEVLQREGFRASDNGQSSRAAEHILEGLRILIIHSGGDSRRLPSYSACGKIFVPLPLQGDGPLQPTLFDKQLPVYQALPSPRFGGGQIVITAGDVLMLFDPRQLEFLQEGITGVGGLSSPTEASHHGVFCRGKAGLVRRFLQKPSVEEQRRRGAIDRYGRSLLDTGVFAFDASFAAKLLELCGFSSDRGRLRWSEDFEERTFSHPVDF